MNNNEKLDIRKIPIKNWDPLNINVKVEGKWISFYHTVKKKKLNQIPNFNQIDIKKPNLHKRTSSFNDNQINYLDGYELLKRKNQKIQELQSLKIDSKEINSNNDPNFINLKPFKPNLENDFRKRSQSENPSSRLLNKFL